MRPWKNSHATPDLAASVVTPDENTGLSIRERACYAPPAGGRGKREGRALASVSLARRGRSTRALASPEAGPPGDAPKGQSAAPGLLRSAVQNVRSRRTGAGRQSPAGRRRLIAFRATARRGSYSENKGDQGEQDSHATIVREQPADVARRGRTGAPTHSAAPTECRRPRCAVAPRRLPQTQLRREKTKHFSRLASFAHWLAKPACATPLAVGSASPSLISAIYRVRLAWRLRFSPVDWVGRAKEVLACVCLLSVRRAWNPRNHTSMRLLGRKLGETPGNPLVVRQPTPFAVAQRIASVRVSAVSHAAVPGKQPVSQGPRGDATARATRPARLHVDAPILVEVPLSAAIGRGAAEVGHVEHAGFSFGWSVSARAHDAEHNGGEPAHGNKGSGGPAITNRMERPGHRARWPALTSVCLRALRNGDTRASGPVSSLGLTRSRRTACHSSGNRSGRRAMRRQEQRRLLAPKRQRQRLIRSRDVTPAPRSRSKTSAALARALTTRAVVASTTRRATDPVGSARCCDRGHRPPSQRSPIPGGQVV
jgi:hypothetical protein